MGEIIEAVRAYYEQDDWPYVQLEDQPILKTAFRGSNGQWTCYAQEREGRQMLVFHSILPFRVPEERRPAVAEYITRANYGLFSGNFEMDFTDGELRFKTSLDLEDNHPSQAQIRNTVLSNVAFVDRYLPGLLQVLHAERSPEAAYEECEAQAQERRNE